VDERIAEAVVRIFEGHGSIADGKLFEEYLREIAMTLSYLGVGGVNDDRATVFFEGQRGLAVKLLGARADVARIKAQEEQKG